MTLTELRYIVAVARERHFGRAAGEWRIEQTADSVKSLFVDASGRLHGFALNGAATSERARLAQQLPPVLN